MLSYNANDFGSPLRRRIFKYLVAIISTVFVCRLIQLQLIEGSTYRTKSETQAIKQIVREPVRGTMYDRYGRIMVHNAPSFSVLITPKEFQPSSASFLAKILGWTEEELLDKVNRFRAINPFVPVKIFRDADFAVIAAIEENRALLPGVDIVSESKRTYNFFGNSAHLIGYNKEIDEKSLAKLGTYYQQGDVIGSSGLESTYENFLRGVKGLEFYAVNSIGQKVASFNDGKSDVNSQDGFDLNLSIDIALQDFIDSVMTANNYRGAAVAMDPSNGEILAFVSKPDFDLRNFSGRTPTNLYVQMLNDTTKPLFNRASLTRYPPGSTWKMMMALAALQDGIIDSNTVFHCGGSYTYGGRAYKCHGGHAHGAVNVRKSIHVSCNVFYYQLALRIGMQRFLKFSEMFGFGARTGMDISEENSGLLPTYDYMNKRFGKNGWTEGGRMINWGIGQGELGVTPLQMAAYCSALANGGTWYQPHTVRSIVNKRMGNTVQPVSFAERKLPIAPEHFNLIRRAMYDVVNVPGGTASVAKIPGIMVAGKTGTAQNAHGKDHAWFVCFAPLDNPKIAMCVMVENAGFGGAIAAPIAQKAMSRYLFPHTYVQPNKIDSSMYKPKEPLAPKAIATAQ
jgi:penicillin-binding protein 2